MVVGELIEKRALHPADSGAARVRAVLDREAAERARRGELSITEAMDQAGWLAVRVKWEGADAAIFRVDEMLRTSFWDPERR